MKIGILTFINTINFGASLQAYALQETLNKMGEKAEIIRYKNKDIEDKEKNKGKRSLNLKGIYRQLIMGNGLRKKTEAFKKYEEKNLRFGLELNEKDFKEINNYYDLFITGSDQVWNMRITEKNYLYFLNFVNDNNKKISYAPSFGNDKFPEEEKENTANLLSQFKAISVREKSGSELIKKISNIDATVVLDPTLLLDKEEWENRIEFVPNLKHYILVYFPHDKKKVFDFVKILKKKTGLPVVYLSISPKIQKGVKTIYNASPDEFLGWMKNADYVVTGSFHGTAFSINLNKEFFYEPSGDGSRIGNLVNISGTVERSIENLDAIGNKIDYTIVNKNMKIARNKSLEWLKSAIGKEE